MRVARNRPMPVPLERPTTERVFPAPVPAPRPDGPLGEDVQPLRRRNAVPVRRRRKLLRRLRRLMIALVVISIPGGIAGWMLSTSVFALDEVRVEGNERVEGAWVESILDAYSGQNLFVLSLDTVEARLTEHPWIAGVSATKELPRRLRVVVEERIPVALWDAGDRWWLVDRAGDCIVPIAAVSDFDLLRLRAGGRYVGAGPRQAVALRRGLEVADRVTAVEPGWGSRITQVVVLSEEDFRLEGEGLPFPVLLAPDRVEIGMAALRLTLRDIAQVSFQVAEVDLRFEGRVVVRPEAGDGVGPLVRSRG